MKALTLFFLLFLIGCRQLVEDEFPPFSKAPVANSIIKAGEPISVNLSYTGTIDAAPLAFIENAQVHLYVDDVLTQPLEHTGEGIYLSEVTAEPQTTYHFEIMVPGFETLSSTQTLPEINTIYNIDGRQLGYMDEEGVTYPYVSFTFDNDPSVIRYYQVVLYKIQDDGNKILFDHIRNTDPVLLAEGLPLTTFSTENIDTDTYTMKIIYRGGYFGDLIVEFRSVSYDYYQFVKQRYLYQSGRYPNIVGGVVTAFPMHSNIENGYGIFAGYSATVTNTGIEF